MFRFTLLLSLCLVAASAEFTSLSQTDFDTAYDALWDFYKANKQQIPKGLRLAFHDCVGGCDGCINLDNASNNGLAEIIDLLDVEYAAVSGIMSRADFWALAGQVGVEWAININNKQCVDEGCAVTDTEPFTFMWGRNDCATSPTTTDVHEFPEPDMDYAEVIDYYSDPTRAGFSFNANQVSALMGAHTLGTAAPENSGFVGTWITGEKLWFNNKYYTHLTDGALVYSQRNVQKASGSDVAKWQWVGNDASGVKQAFMLGSDVCLFKDIQLNDEGKSTCEFDDCAESDTADMMRTYAEDQDAWIAEFADVYHLMTLNGYDSLNAIGA